jgi:hypothetical protein
MVLSGQYATASAKTRGALPEARSGTEETMKKTLTKASKSKIQKPEASAPYRVLLSSCGNPDFNQYAPISPRGAVDAVSLWDCREICNAYIGKFGLGGGNWSGGEIIDNKTGKCIAHVSYNGRIWEGPIGQHGKEILIAKKPETMKDLAVGQDFTFPEGTEDAGVRFTVLEQNGTSAICLANIDMAIKPQMEFKGDEKIVLL